MCSATLDINRRSWTREDWENYNKKDAEFAEKFQKAMYNGDLEKIQDLVEEGKDYFHFPDIGSMQILFADNMDFYLTVMSLRNLFYKYETI